MLSAKLYNDLCILHCKELHMVVRNAGNIEHAGRELERRLDTRTKVENGAFGTAEEVLTWMIEEGWVTAEQINGDSTILSEEA